jgi:menaquinone-dependent protoporphyrinogen oxidase
MMELKVLVAYASKYGATAEIAGKIGEVLRQEELQADVLPVKEVKDLTLYGVVVLGTAAYMFRWRKDATGFLKANEKTLAGLPVWLFVSGPIEKGDPVELLKGKVVPNSMQPVIDRIKPVDLTVFHGVIQPDKMNAFERWVMKKMKASAEDFRDWEAIASWAKSIAGELKKKASGWETDI